MIFVQSALSNMWRIHCICLLQIYFSSSLTMTASCKIPMQAILWLACMYLGFFLIFKKNSILYLLHEYCQLLFSFLFHFQTVLIGMDSSICGENRMASRNYDQSFSNNSRYGTLFDYDYDYDEVCGFQCWK